MKLSTLLQDSGLRPAAGDGDPELTDLHDDSRRAGPGSLFVARDTGDERWKTYARQAADRGAAAVVAPAEVELPPEIPLVVGPEIDQRLAGRLAARFFGHPADRLRLIGITGTNGKTTVATLTQYLLNRAGQTTDERCGLIGTVAIDDGSPDGPRPAELTTPGAIDLQRHFAAMVRHGCTACAMEVSSHALQQGRVDGLRFAVTVFTNLTQDHLDYHGTMEAYAAAKARLFAMLGDSGVAVLNVDGPAWRAMRVPWDRVIGTTTRHPEQNAGGPTAAEADCLREVWTARVRQMSAEHAEVEAGRIDLRGQPIDGPSLPPYRLPLVGRHNVMNALQAAVAAASAARQAVPTMLRGLADCPPVPGRLEPVRMSSEGKNQPARPAVVVDYAHSPDALENVLTALRPVTAGRLICVFGCGGDRDRTKRPLMAAIASTRADRAVLTSDNPRTEDPQQILDDAWSGVAEADRGKVTRQLDRAEAIRQAVAAAQPDDTVLIAGKGHEDYQVLGTEKVHFDDREHAAAALQEWGMGEQKEPRDGHPSALGEGGA